LGLVGDGNLDPFVDQARRKTQDDRLSHRDPPQSETAAPPDANDSDRGSDAIPVSGSAGPSEPAEDESTVGTGSAIALGCVAATLLLIVLGLVLLAFFALVR